MEDLVKLFEDLKEQIAVAEGEFEKFTTKGNKSAGTRVRGAMQTVKGLAQSIRLGVQSAKKA
jgi:hypothetical protein